MDRITAIEQEQTRALISASMKGDKLEVLKLCRRGCHVDLPDEDGLTAILHAAIGGHHEVIEVLCQQDANLSVCDKNGRTALHFASTLSYPEVAKVLIHHQADVDYQDCQKNTALHDAISRGHSRIVNILLNAGAKLNLKNKKGQTAKSLAKQSENSEIKRLFQEEQIRREQASETKERASTVKTALISPLSSKSYKPKLQHSSIWYREQDNSTGVFGLSFKLCTDTTSSPTTVEEFPVSPRQ